MKYYSIILWILLGINNLFASNTSLLISTNTEVRYEAQLSHVQFGKPFLVKYTMPIGMHIIAIDSNITIQKDTDIHISNLQNFEFEANVIPYSVVPYAMPSFLITALDKNNQTNQFYTPSFTIPISNDMATNTNLTLKDIEQPYFVWDHWWTICMIGFFLIILLLSLFNKVKKTKKMEQNPQVTINPFELVESKLKILKMQSTTLTEETYKEFFVELSETIREFLSYTIIPLALETPTRELLKELKIHQTNEELLEVITFILRSTDRAKYAKQIFTEERINTVIEESFKLIKLIEKQQEMEKNNEL